jgi:hypothetical protein
VKPVPFHRTRIDDLTALDAARPEAAAVSRATIDQVGACGRKLLGARLRRDDNGKALWVGGARWRAAGRPGAHLRQLRCGRNLRRRAARS